MKRTITISDTSFILYEQSIKVEGMGNVFYFGRKVEFADARQLSDLIKVGKEQMRNEIKNLLQI